MTSSTSKKIAYTAASQFKESFYEPSPTVGYAFIGNHLPYTDENTPPSIIDSTSDEKKSWDNMIGAKKITGNDVEFVVPRVSWTASSKYKQYDDVVPFEQLLTGNTSLSVKPMYVMTSARNVYKCLSNNNSALSTIEPTGDYTSSNGNIATSDGYIWKYMFNVKPSNKFLTNEWIPTPTSTAQIDYGVNSIGVVDGELTTIVVTNSGTGYYESNISIPSVFPTSCSILTISSADIISGNISTLSANMSISGVGITPGSYISAVDISGLKITLSTPTTAAGGGGTAANQLSLTTRVYVDGDGTSIVATPVLNTANMITKVTVSTIGRGYSRANAYVYGTGTNATLRCILDPKYGHAYNPAKELGANNIMVAVKIGEIDSSENGKISANTTFRQYGIFVDPHKYADANVITQANANSVVSLTTDISVDGSSPSYTLDEFVYQGTSISTASAYGFVLDQTSNLIKLTNVKGTFTTGLSLVGATSGTSRLIIGSATPEFQPYSGDVLYTENAVKTTRADGQAENIRLIVRF
jgi:hypothetical protein